MTSVVSSIVTGTLCTVMVALGLSLRPGAMRQWGQRPGLVARFLIGSCLLVPLLALLLLQMPWSEAISRPARHGIALMALCPSAPLALRKAGDSGGDRQLAALLQISAALAAALSIPLMGLAFRHTFQLQGWDVRPWDVAGQVLRVQVFPLLLGVVLRLRAPQLAQHLERPLNRLANLLLLALLAVVLLKAGPQLFSYLAANLAALPAMVLLSVAALLIGAAMAGEDGPERATTALVSGMRNPGLALYFAGVHGGDLPGVKLVILGYVLVTVLVSMPFVRFTQKRNGL
ncbi:MAG: transporter [Cyanobium sp.]